MLKHEYPGLTEEQIAMNSTIKPFKGVTMIANMWKALLNIDFGSRSNPLKYREYQYTVAELERRLVAEVNQFDRCN